MIEGVTRTQLAIAAVVVVVLVGAVAAFALRSGGGDSTAREQVLADVEAIRGHELDHKNVFGDFIAADAAPRAPHEVGADPVPWKASRGFVKLSWEPAEPERVYGSYSVVLSDGGFTVIGVADGDGDGRSARIEATATEPAHLVTSEDIY